MVGHVGQHWFSQSCDLRQVSMPRLQPLPLSNEGWSRVTSEGHMKLLLRKWTRGLGHLSDPVSWTEIRFYTGKPDAH